ncbi:MAG: glycosyltransferase [Adlercreutzia equolifaciens]
MLVSVVIPCYYSEKMIGTVVDQTRAELVKAGYEYEFILVNDGSTDGTFAAIEQLCAADDRVVGINCAKNSGQHNAIMAGLRKTEGDLILLMDDDMQTHPSQCVKLLDAMEDGSDIVFACWDEHKEAWWRELGSKFTIWSMRVLTDRPKEIYSSNFAVFRRHIRDEVVRYQGPYVYIQGLLFRATANIKNVKVEHYERAQGTSGYSLKSLIRLWSTVLNYSGASSRRCVVGAASVNRHSVRSHRFHMRLPTACRQAGLHGHHATFRAHHFVLGISIPRTHVHDYQQRSAVRSQRDHRQPLETDQTQPFERKLVRKKIVIFGAGGTLGLYLVDHLSHLLPTDEWEVIASGRSDIAFFNRYAPLVRYVQADITGEKSFAALPQQDVYAVVHFAGALPAYMEATIRVAMWMPMSWHAERARVRAPQEQTGCCTPRPSPITPAISAR